MKSDDRKVARVEHLKIPVTWGQKEINQFKDLLESGRFDPKEHLDDLLHFLILWEIDPRQMMPYCAISVIKAIERAISHLPLLMEEGVRLFQMPMENSEKEITRRGEIWDGIQKYWQIMEALGAIKVRLEMEVAETIPA